ncbi:flavin reductase family protein [Microtetraspora niveoalba]|uniref:flavin reductase family protein n=1 Tax=Microtetraspora niveoalba TaxID=46175 RepID=UPI00083031B1|nr:flavin reductase family protein [Microtetraspora niveoalba]
MSIAALRTSGGRGPCAPTAADMRRVMGQFATGVTIVTGLDRGEPVGFACQSFASVSLEPPLVLFCADHRGRTWPRIRESGRFTVNVLAERQGDLCARFGSSRGARFEGLDWTPSRWDTPSLPGVLVRVHCDVETAHVAGDHDIVVGRVLELEWVGEEAPLLFFRGRFGVGDAASEAALPPAEWGWRDHWW